MHLRFTLKFLSDFHLGTGKGSSEVDSLLMRESDDLGSPIIIKGTTIVGTLRQALYDLLQLPPFEKDRKCKSSGLNSAHIYCTGPRTDQCPICRILGTPEQEKRWYFSVGQPVANMATQMVTRSSIDRETRTSEDRKLFSYEAGGKDTKFSFSVEHDRSTIDVMKDAAYIVAGFRFIRSLGSSKRRGKGACIISLDSIEPEITKKAAQGWFLEIFKQLHTGNKIDVQIEQSKQEISVESSEYMIEIVADEPILITQNMGSGNLYSGLDYIPGQTLRGAFAWKAIRGGILDTQEGRNIFKEMYERNKFQVSEIYPAPDECEKAAIPIPLAMRFCEFYPNEHEVTHNGESSNLCESCKKKGIHSKMDKIDGFIDPNILSLQPDSTHDMHIAIDPGKRVVKRGNLYEYSSISKGTRFLGTAHLEPEIFAKFLKFLHHDVTTEKDRITIHLHIGKATSRGYGKAHLTFIPEVGALKIFTWEPIEKRILSINKPIIMNFISDTVLRDKYGRYCNKITEALLNSLIGYKTKICKNTVRTKQIERFDASSGLPRWQDSAIIAGSVVEFTLDDGDKISLEDIRKRLKDMEEKKIGLNTSTGFGMICFNHPIRFYERHIGHQQSPSTDNQESIELKSLKSLAKESKKSMVAIARLLYTGKWGLDELQGKLKELEKEKQDNLVDILKEMIQKIEAQKDTKKMIHKLAEYICSICEGGT